ncbi:hypothetical protein SNE40_022057 [Patella caerulea]|uniref:CARD domain-containing protein n=1 Tax=Patella caerulea TaxID=87958 RepID=A0AAN8GJG2_PATCE
MNAIQKSVLKRQTPKIADGIIMNEDILSALLANEIFQSSMIDIIRAESTPTNRAYKMLELLPKRGPEAFSGFIDIIQKDYPWLATSLQSEVDHIMSGLPDQIDGKPKARLYSSDYDEGSSKKSENVLNDIRKKVRTFVHKQFGQSKKLAEKDKKLITNWMTDQITNERLRLQSISASESCNDHESDPEDDKYNQSRVQDELYKLHLKLEPFLLRKDDTESMSRNSHHIEDMTFSLLSEELDQVCLILCHLQDEIDASLDQFESCVRDKGLQVLVESLILKYNNQNESLDKEGKRNTELMNDLSEYSEEIHKLETERANMRRQIDFMHKDLSLLRHDKFKAQEDVKHLNNKNHQHIQTIDNLESKIQELQSSKSTKDKSSYRFEHSQSPVRRSQQSPQKAVNFNTPIFSKRSGQYYGTSHSRMRTSRQVSTSQNKSK